MMTPNKIPKIKKIILKGHKNVLNETLNICKLWIWKENTIIILLKKINNNKKQLLK